MEVESIIVNRPEISKHTSIVLHPALGQRLYAAIQHHDENHLLMDWLMVVCLVTWPNKADISLHMGLWTSMEDFQTSVKWA